MRKPETRTLGGIVLDEHLRLTLTEVCTLCEAREELIVEMVHEGIVEVFVESPQQWVFSGDAVIRIQAALRLLQDLRLNLPGAALALELLDEIERLRRRPRG